MTSLTIREFNVRFWLYKLASISINFENLLSIHYSLFRANKKYKAHISKYV